MQESSRRQQELLRAEQRRTSELQSRLDDSTQSIKRLDACLLDANDALVQSGQWKAELEELRGKRQGLQALLTTRDREIQALQASEIQRSGIEVQSQPVT